jgi:hypothetical protein
MQPASAAVAAVEKSCAGGAASETARFMANDPTALALLA